MTKTIPKRIFSMLLVFSIFMTIVINPFFTENCQAATTVSGSQIVAELRTHCGKTPYVYGGNSWSGTDCSGMICLVYEKFGINLWPWRTDFIGGLSNIGTNVGTNPANAKAGDIIVYSGHCSIAVDSNTCIQCQCSTGVTERTHSYMQQYFSPIKMIIRPYAISSQPGNNMATSCIDICEGGNMSVRVAGWAFDKDTPSQSLTIHVYVDDKFCCDFKANGNSPDVNSAYGISGKHRFDKTFSVSPGKHKVVVFALDSGGDYLCNSGNGPYDVTVTGANLTPNLCVDYCENRNDSLYIQGWAFDGNASSKSLTIHVYVDGQFFAEFVTTDNSPDVNSVYGISGNHRFAKYFNVSPGSHKIIVFALDNEGDYLFNAGAGPYDVTITGVNKVSTPVPTAAPTAVPTADSTVAPTATPTTTTAVPKLAGGIAHIQNIGNVDAVIDSNGILTIGSAGSGKRLEQITIFFENNTPYSGTLQYRVHVQDIGWMDWTDAGQKCGTEGMSKRIEAIEIRLTGELADYYSVEYCVSIQDYGDLLGWVHDGALAGTTGESKRIEELKIRIVPKNSGSSMSVKYRVHVQDYGWEKSIVSDGAMSGTSGEAKRLEGIEIFLSGTQYGGGIKYRTHIQNIGWESTWAKDGEMSGTQGMSYRLEGICIELYGEIANYYDIYYRVHAQDIGWMGWAKNGECAGTAGRAARLEGIQIVLVPKGAPAPATTYEGITAVTDVAFVEGF